MRVSLGDLRRHIGHIKGDAGLSTFFFPRRRTSLSRRKRRGPSFIFPSARIPLFSATCLFRTANNQKPPAPRRQQMNSDEVRVNNSHVLMGEMMNVENTHSLTHTHVHSHVFAHWLGSGRGGGAGEGGSAEGQHRLEGAATVSAVFLGAAYSGVLSGEQRCTVSRLSTV